MIYLVIIFALISACWAFIKNTTLKYISTALMLLFPIIIFLSFGAYIYSVSFAILMLFYLNLNNFQTASKNNYKKIITALPIILIFYWLTINNPNKLIKTEESSMNEINIVIILSSISILVATTSMLLILKRTKGEKIND